MTDWLKLNVGGRMFETSRSTLTSDSDSILSRMFESDRSLLQFPPVSLSQGGLFHLCSHEEIIFKISFPSSFDLELDVSRPGLFQGVYKIDSSPHTFSVILNWLRYRSLVLVGVEAGPPATGGRLAVGAARTRLA